MIDLAQFKLYARVDHDDEDDLILGLIAAAGSAVADMTGKRPPHGYDELWDVAVLQYAAHLYENRTPTESGASPVEVPFTLQTLLNHISLCGRYPEAKIPDNKGSASNDTANSGK